MKQLHWVATGSGIVFAGLMALALAMHVPTIPDEVAYLATARYFAGGVPMNLSMMAYYPFGQALLLTPIAAFAHDPQTFYVASLAVSCAATALVPLPLLSIARMAGFAPTWPLVVAAFLVALAPAYFGQSFQVWPEATFRLFFVVLFWLLATAWTTRRLVWWIAFAICTVWLYVLHRRAMGMLPLAVGMIAYAAYIRRISRVGALGSVVLMAVPYFAARRADAHLGMLFRGFVETVGGQVRAFVGYLASPDAIGHIAALAWGQIWAVSAASAGIFVVGAAACLSIAHANREMRGPIIFLLLAALGVLAAAMLQLGYFVDAPRIDHVIYERYLEGVTTPIVWLGLAGFLSGVVGRRTVALGGLVLLSGAGLAALLSRSDFLPFVGPNISGLQWVNLLAPMRSLSVAQIVLVASTGALACLGLVALPERRVLALATLTIAIGAADLASYAIILPEHLGREDYIAKSTVIYARAAGSVIHWDKSAGGNSNLAVDQFAAVNAAMPSSDLAKSDIDKGSAAVVGPGFSKAGYSCLGTLPDGNNLIFDGKNGSCP